MSIINYIKIVLDLSTNAFVAGSAMALLFNCLTFDICYVSNILTVGSEVVISFLNRADPFHRVCFFCNFVRNTIYVLNEPRFQVVLMASKHNSGKAPILMLDCMISQVSCGL